MIAIGCNWVMTATPVASEAWMMLPWATWRRPGAAGERRDDLGIAEGGLGVIRSRPGRPRPSAFLLRDHGALGVELLFGAGVGRRQLLRRIRSSQHVAELRLVLRLLGDGLIVLRLVDRGIDLAEHIALLDVLSLDKARGRCRRRRDRPARPRYAAPPPAPAPRDPDGRGLPPASGARPRRDSRGRPPRRARSTSRSIGAASASRCAGRPRQRSRSCQA